MTSASRIPPTHTRRQPAARPSGALQERLYFACPMTEYDSQHYQEMRAAAIRHFPLATVLEPKRLFRSRQHWLTTWPELLPTLTRVVFFTAPDGWLGRGVVTELQDVRARQLPIHLLSEHGELIPWTRLTFTIPNRGNWTRHLQVSVRPCPE